MSYTWGLLSSAANWAANVGFHKVVPFSDKITGSKVENLDNPSLTNLKNRQKVARSMQRAIAEGKLDSSYSEVVGPMQEKTAQQLKAKKCETYTNLQYACEQIGKTSTIAKFAVTGLAAAAVPGAGIVATGIARVSQINMAAKTGNVLVNLPEDAVTKATNVAKVLSPLVITTLAAKGVAAAAPIVIPIIREYITPTNVGLIAAVPIVSAVALETFMYIKNRTPSFSSQQPSY